MSAATPDTTARRWIAGAGLLGGVGVTLGAFGAHGLRDRVSPAALEIYKTGVLYQLIHAVALLVLAVAATHTEVAGARVARVCFLLGTIVFSGSLYALALSGRGWWGAVTPAGGLLFLIGWAALVVGGARRRS